jgi:hypothetical protein
MRSPTRQRSLPLCALWFLLAVGAARPGAASPPGLSPPVFLPGDAALAPAAGWQQSPELAASNDGFLAVWVDDRTGITQMTNFSGGAAFDYHIGSAWDIHAARLDRDGDAIDQTPIIIAEQIQNQGIVDVGWNGQNWLVVFTGQEGMQCCPVAHLYVVRVSPSGVVLDDPPIRIDVAASFELGYPVRVASDGVNWAVVGPTRLHDNVFGALGMRIAPDGTVLDPSGVVLASDIEPYNIDMVFSGGQYFLVSGGGFWTNPGRILGQRLNPSLTPIGPVVVVNPYSPTNALNFRIAANGQDFFVTWFENRYASFAQVVGARVTSAGVVQDPNGLALTAASGSVQYEPAVAWDGTNYVVVYYTYGPAPEEVFAVRVSPAGKVLDYDRNRIPVTAAPDRQTDPVIEHVPGGRTVIAWRDDRCARESQFGFRDGMRSDIYATTFATNGSVGAERCIALGAPRQTHLRLTPNETGYLAVFHSETSPESRIAAQRIDAAGNAIDPEPVVVARGGWEVKNPSVAWNGSEYFVVWENSVTNRTFGRRLAADLSLLDAAPITLLPGNTPDVAALGDVFLVVASYEQPREIRQIYSQRVRGSDGAILDATPRVIGANFSLAPRVTSFASQWLAAWEQHPTHDDPFSQVYASRVAADGVSSGGFVASGAGGKPAVAAGPDQALIVWEGRQGGSSAIEIFASRWSPDGTLLAPYPLPVTAAANQQFDAAIAWTGDGYAVAFGDFRNDDVLESHRGDLFGSRVDPAGNVLDPDGFVVAADSIPEMFPHVASNGGGFVVGASQFRQDPGYVAYRIALRAVSGTVAVDPGGAGAQGGSRLSYSPNPSAKLARILLTGVRAGPASVTVYDLEGREVRRIFEGPVAGRELHLEWNLRDKQDRAVDSGVYFLRARTADGPKTIKVIVAR